MKTICLVALVLAALGGALSGHGSHTALADGEYGTLYIDVLPDASNTTDDFGPIEVCRDTDDLGGPLDIGDTFTIDVLIDDAPQIDGAGLALNYTGTDMPPAVLRVTTYDWFNWKFGPGVGSSDPMPDTDGSFYTVYTGDTTSGDGVILRLHMEAVGNGTSDLTLTHVEVEDAESSFHYPPEVLVDDPLGEVRVVVGDSCPLPVGGVAGLPDVSDSAGRNHVAIAALAALVALSAGGFYVRRRWLR
jgi:hypothetical protein